MFPATLAQWLGPLLAAGLVAGLVGIGLLLSGMLDLSASKPHHQGWAQILHFAFERSTRHHSAGLAIPADFGSPAQIAKGATYYGMACAHCHGGPGLGQNPIALSMTPRPQYLVHDLPQFTERDLFWIVKHGVKYSAMPGWPVQDRDDEVWSVVAFLRHMPRMTTARFRDLAYGETDTAGPPPGIGPVGNSFASRTYTVPHSDEPPRASYRYTTPAIGFDAFALTGDATTGCARCHGSRGAGRPGGAIPNIALLDRGYFVTELRKFATGARHSGFMLPVATQLSDTQMEALARYYTAQPRTRSDDVRASPDTLALGRQIAASGLAARGVGACASCHDITRRATKAFPAIDGQHAAYLRDRLAYFKTQRVVAPAANPMIAIAHRLTEREIDAVALFYASRQPAAPRPLPVTGHARTRLTNGTVLADRTL